MVELALPPNERNQPKTTKIEKSVPMVFLTVALGGHCLDFSERNLRTGGIHGRQPGHVQPRRGLGSITRSERFNSHSHIPGAARGRRAVTRAVGLVVGCADIDVDPTTAAVAVVGDGTSHKGRCEDSCRKFGRHGRPAWGEHGSSSANVTGDVPDFAGIAFSAFCNRGLPCWDRAGLRCHVPAGCGDHGRR